MNCNQFYKISYPCSPPVNWLPTRVELTLRTQTLTHPSYSFLVTQIRWSLGCREKHGGLREKVNLNTMDMVSGGDADWGKVHGERSILGLGSDFWCFYKEYMHRVLRNDRLKVFASWIQNSKMIIQRTKYQCIYCQCQKTKVFHNGIFRFVTNNLFLNSSTSLQTWVGCKLPSHCYDNYQQSLR